MRLYRITSKVVLFVKLSKISLSATSLHGHSRGEISLWWVSGLPSSQEMLKKYIKADNLKVVEKLHRQIRLLQVICLIRVVFCIILQNLMQIIRF